MGCGFIRLGLERWRGGGGGLRGGGGGLEHDMMDEE
jgi:hypothetical protein